MFDLNELASQFEKKTQLLSEARDELFSAAECVYNNTENLANAKTAAVNSGRVDGKNDEIRKAQIAEICAREIEALRAAEYQERSARCNYEQAQLSYDLTRYLLRIAELAAK